MVIFQKHITYHQDAADYHSRIARDTGETIDGPHVHLNAAAEHWEAVRYHIIDSKQVEPLTAEQVNFLKGLRKKAQKASRDAEAWTKRQAR